MRILGHGIDLYEMAAVARHLQDTSGDWVSGVFTEAEVRGADPPPHDVEYYAGRYAAKEAVAKALGTGFTDDVTWQDVEILRRPAGSPEVRLDGGALAAATGLGITTWYVSISHRGGFAIASAIATSG